MLVKIDFVHSSQFVCGEILSDRNNIILFYTGIGIKEFVKSDIYSITKLIPKKIKIINNFTKPKE